MIKLNDVEYRTEKQWNEKHRAILKRQRDKGIRQRWYIDQKNTAEAVFYREEQTRPYNKRELDAAKRKRKKLIETRKKRLSCGCCGEYFGCNARYILDGEGLCDFCGRDHTSWQWLDGKHMVPKKNAEPYSRRPNYWDPWTGELVSSEREWYYYDHTQVRPVSDKRFEVLKRKYIKMYGGWEKIDLEHTEYNGQKWW